jgi:large repetitive protein
VPGCRRRPSFACDLVGSLAAGDEVVVDIEVAVASDVQGTIVNTARVDSPTPDPVPGNNEDSDTSPFGTLADLSIAKTNTGSPVTAGENVTWELVVTNNGPSDSQPVISVVDLLPATVAFQSAAGEGLGVFHDTIPARLLLRRADLHEGRSAERRR